jgi:hypothetical protein
MINFSLLVLVLLLTSCHKRIPKQENALVTLTDKVQAIDSINLILHKTINEINNNPNYDNLILFIHGRGKHPEKAFKQNLLSDLEHNYTAKVIMFHWPSWQGTYGFPTQKARNSAIDLIRVLKSLENYKQSHKDETNNIKFTLFTNSMGSIVLEQAMRDYNGSLGQVFDTLLINASSSVAKDHSVWVDKINFSENTYITINQEDKLLGKLGIRYFGKRLGKGTTSILGNDFMHSSNASYINVTKYKLNHRYYLHRDLIGKPELLEFYNDILNGLLPKVLVQCSYGRRNPQIRLL